MKLTPNGAKAACKKDDNIFLVNLWNKWSDLSNYILSTARDVNVLLQYKISENRKNFEIVLMHLIFW